MTGFHLTPTQRAALRRVARHSPDGRAARRALALLDLDRGEPVAGVARRFQVARDTVYEWAGRLRRSRLPAAQRLADAPRPGRPARQRAAAEPLIRAALLADPRRFGYRHPAWTAGLLRQHLRRAHGVAVSLATVRRAVRRLGLRWKRPRFALSRRARHWGQAKGGSSGG
jgi:transposase